MLSAQLKRFDAYPKTLEDFRVRTYSGACISLLALGFILFLFFSELAFFLTTDVEPMLSVDTTRGQKLQINVDVVFPHLPCVYVGVDAMDVSGEAQLELDHNMLKRRLSPTGEPINTPPEREALLGKEKPSIVAPPGLNAQATDDADTSVEARRKRAQAAASAANDDTGQTDAGLLSPEGGAHDSKDNGPLDPNRCESCFGAETANRPCCNTCAAVRDAYRERGWALSSPETVPQCAREGFSQRMVEQRGEGCHIYGHIMVNKVAGNFHFAPGKSFQSHHMHVHDLAPFKQGKFNLSHTINSISFGKPFPGAVNPLDGVVKATPVEGSAVYQYFVKIVPTIYQSLSGETIHTNQFSVTEHFRPLESAESGAHSHDQGLPGVFFMYDLSPIMVEFREKQKSWAHFITSLCAIIGGVYSVAGMLDSFVYHSLRSLEKKIELGKQN